MYYLSTALVMIEREVVQRVILQEEDHLQDLQDALEGRTLVLPQGTGRENDRVTDQGIGHETGHEKGQGIGLQNRIHRRARRNRTTRKEVVSQRILLTNQEMDQRALDSMMKLNLHFTM